MNNLSFHYISPLSVFFTCLVLLGCGSKEINPLEDERGIYSFYGALDMERSTNYIRVRDLRLPHLAEQTIGENTVITFEDLEKGTSIILLDSLVDFSGNITHNYILNKTLQPRQPYRITARRNDGALSESIANTPGITIAGAVPDENVSCGQRITFHFDNVLPSEQIRVDAGFEYEGEMYWFEITRYCDFKYDEFTNRVSLEKNPINLLGLVFPPQNINIPQCQNIIPRISCDELSSDVAYLRYYHLGPEWQRIFPVIQVNPDNVKDVENGLGFFGAYRSDLITYTLSINSENN